MNVTLNIHDLTLSQIDEAEMLHPFPKRCVGIKK